MNKTHQLLRSSFNFHYTFRPSSGEIQVQKKKCYRRGFLSVPVFHLLVNMWGHAVAQLVEALRYKPDGRGFDSWNCFTFSDGQYV
jgi:hypothetical protein